VTTAYKVAPVDPAEGETQTGDGARPIGAIVTDLWEKTETLVRQEMRLGIAEAEEKVDALKVDLDHKVQQLKLELFAKAIGGVVAFAGILTIIAGIVAALALAIPLWLAALVVGAGLALGGMALLKREARIPDPPPASALIPERTIHNVKRDIHAIEETVHDTAK
jgi:hypothetical protein